MQDINHFAEAAAEWWAETRAFSFQLLFRSILVTPPPTCLSVYRTQKRNEWGVGYILCTLLATHSAASSFLLEEAAGFFYAGQHDFERAAVDSGGVAAPADNVLRERWGIEPLQQCVGREQTSRDE